MFSPDCVAASDAGDQFRGRADKVAEQARWCDTGTALRTVQRSQIYSRFRFQRRPRMSQSAIEQTSVTQLSGVGPAIAERLEKLGIRSIADLLFHLPLRYEDRTRLTPIRLLQSGEHVQIEGRVEEVEQRFSGRRSLHAWLRDEHGDGIELRFFHFNRAQQERLQQGGAVRAFGEVRYGRRGLEMVHPELRWLKAGETTPLPGTLTPVYPVTEGLSQISLRKFIGMALQRLTPYTFPELLPDDLCRERQLPALHLALRAVHQPPVGADVGALLRGDHPAVLRLVMEELIAAQLSFLQLRDKLRAQRAPALRDAKHYGRDFLAALPFAPTGAQQRVVAQLQADLEQPQPMLRLVQGDVGSGKTLVAALAALTAIGSDQQCALMAPTELLAEQHVQNFRRWFEPLGIRVVALLGKQKGRARSEAEAQVADGSAQMVIGTHALFQDSVQFARLALCIIDEQHRFGVHQRMSLWQKGGDDAQLLPHQLVMTATPIPRTLAMTAYADLDISVIDELPPGRTPISTVVIPENRREEVIARVRLAGAEGRQVYWVCTLIEESEELQLQAAEATAELLRRQLPGLRVGLVHGRMKAAEKQAAMLAFKAHELDLLVATTVIEVGVDVPNASLMIIENAERLGLAQLHQLRGRVGRGATQSHCLLMYRGPLSALGRERLQVMRETTDGFRIAEKDLELRGPGELLGTRQTGVMQFRIADIARDARWVADAQRGAQHLRSQYPQLVPALIRRWLGARAQYGQV